METKIYTLSSSNNPDIIRYIGKTKESLKKRLAGHITLAKINKIKGYFHNYTSNWINKEIELGNTIIIKELDSTSENNWEYLEKYWISQFKAWGFNLTNLTDGGDGNKNQYFSKESNLARSIALKGKKRPKEVCLKISKSSLGKKLTEKHKLNVKNSIIALQGKPVIQYTLDGIFVKEWRCGTYAANFYNINKTSISKCCKGKYKSSAGFVWKFKE